MIRDDNGILTDKRKEMIKEELGDTLWYIATLAFELEIEFDDIAIKITLKN